MTRFLGLLLLLAIASSSFGDDETPKPILLVARKGLADPFFGQSVVLVTNYGAIAPLGVIINRPTQLTLASAFPDIQRLCSRDDKVFFGGPVQPDELTVLFRAVTPPKDAVRVLDGVYISSDDAVIRELLAREKPVEGLRVFAGHAGWAPGQLEGEIERGGWHLAAADARTLFEKKPESLWPELERKASAIMAWLSSGSARPDRTPSRP